MNTIGQLIERYHRKNNTIIGLRIHGSEPIALETRGQQKISDLFGPNRCNAKIAHLCSYSGSECSTIPIQKSRCHYYNPLFRSNDLHDLLRDSGIQVVMAQKSQRVFVALWSVCLDLCGPILLCFHDTF